MRIVDNYPHSFVPEVCIENKRAMPEKRIVAALVPWQVPQTKEKETATSCNLLPATFHNNNLRADSSQPVDCDQSSFRGIVANGCTLGGP